MKQGASRPKARCWPSETFLLAETMGKQKAVSSICYWPTSSVAGGL
jgi:hypothetical protein